ncbi:MAG: hypothetical protein RIR62_1824 [Pseudomonadota bacterium]|jgi:predicted transcriptional regulator
MAGLSPDAGQSAHDHLATLRDRLAEAGEGEFVSAASIEEWMASWFTPDELPPPDPDLRIGA